MNLTLKLSTNDETALFQAIKPLFFAFFLHVDIQFSIQTIVDMCIAIEILSLENICPQNDFAEQKNKEKRTRNSHCEDSNFQSD